jgi:hypothetical protein
MLFYLGLGAWVNGGSGLVIDLTDMRESQAPAANQLNPEITQSPGRQSP